jgi:hypothetical protein
MCLPSQDIDYITNVNWPTKNLNQELTLAAQSQFEDYTQFDVVHPLAIDNVCQQNQQSLCMRIP